MPLLKTLRCFAPVVDRRSRVLILGSMPGPEALRKKQYYGFEGNHFWRIVPALLGAERPVLYRDRIRLMRSNGIALWDVLRSCVRPTALDGDISRPEPNDIPGLLRRFPGIRAVFVNGGYAWTMFQRRFEGDIDRPAFRLPSTSPANAAMPVGVKQRKWAAILEYLELNARPSAPASPRREGRRR